MHSNSGMVIVVVLPFFVQPVSESVASYLISEKSAQVPVSVALIQPTSNTDDGHRATYNVNPRERKALENVSE